MAPLDGDEDPFNAPITTPADTSHPVTLPVSEYGIEGLMAQMTGILIPRSSDPHHFTIKTTNALKSVNKEKFSPDVTCWLTVLNALKTLLRNHRTINQATQHYHLRVEARINTWKAYLIELSTCKEKDRFNRFGPFELTDVYLYAKIIHGYMVNEAKRILKESGGSEEVLKKASFAGFEIGRDLTAAYQVLYA